MRIRDLKTLSKSLYILIIALFVFPWFLLFLNIQVSDIIQLIAVLLTLTFFGIQSINQEIKRKEEKKSRERDLLGEVQSSFDKLISLLERLCLAQNTKGIAEVFTMTLRSSEKIKKHFGIFPEPVINQSGRNLSDFNIYLLEGSFYIIPNSCTLRKIPIDETEVEQYFTKNDSQQKKRENLDRFYNEIKSFIKRKYNIDIKIKDNLKQFKDN